MTAIKAESYELDDEEEELDVISCRCDSISFFVHHTGIVQCCICGKSSDRWALVRVH